MERETHETGDSSVFPSKHIKEILLVDRDYNLNTILMTIKVADIIGCTLIKNITNYGNISRRCPQIVKLVSSAAKEARIYVVAQLYEKTSCQNRDELISSNLVFDRDGTVVSV